MSLEIAEPRISMTEKVVESIGGVIVSGVESAAKLSVGQALLRMADRFLWVVEKSAQWSLPVQEITAEENGKTFGKMELVRPLPWIFFLPGLVMLRAIRVGLGVGAFILGYPQLQPTGMVKFIQKGRRRLRAIKSSGLKNMRQRKSSRTKDEELSEAKKSLIRSMLATLSALSCLDGSKRTPSPPPTRIHVRNNSETAPSLEENSTTESASPGQSEAKRKFSQVSVADDSSEASEEETLQAKIERLGAEDSANDEDFNPADCTISESSSSDINSEDDLTLEEVNDLKAELATMDFRRPSVAADVIAEEPEPAEDITQPKMSTEEPTVNSGAKTTKQNSEKSEQFESNKSENESDVAFYSPISSKSVSPEPSLSPVRTNSEQQNSQRNNVNSVERSAGTVHADNGELAELDSSATSTLSGNSVEESANGPNDEKRNSGNGKGHKGKRNNLANRKKK